jgi:hypothetical protein
VGVASVALAHLVHRLGEQAFAVEDVGVFGKEAEHQPGHEVIHVGCGARPWPSPGSLQQFDVELVQRPVARTSMGLSLISLIVEMPASGRKEPKWLGKSSRRRRWSRR